MVKLNTFLNGFLTSMFLGNLINYLYGMDNLIYVIVSAFILVANIGFDYIRERKQ